MLEMFPSCILNIKNTEHVMTWFLTVSVESLNDILFLEFYFFRKFLQRGRLW